MVVYYTQSKRHFTNFYGSLGSKGDTERCGVTNSVILDEVLLQTLRSVTWTFMTSLSLLYDHEHLFVM